MSNIRRGDVILQEVEPESDWGRKYLTAWPNEVGIIVCDGKVVEAFWEGRRNLPLKGEVRTYIAYTAPFRLVFRLRDPRNLSELGEGVVLDQPALTKDKQLVTGRIDITLSIVRDNAEHVLRLLKLEGDEVTTLMIANAIEGELLAKVLTFDIERYSAHELRANSGLFREMYDSLGRELSSTMLSYGLQLDNFYPNWGLTDEERRGIENKDLKTRSEPEDLKDGEPQEQSQPPIPPSGPYGLDLGPGFEGLSPQGKGKQARAAYLRSVGVHSASSLGRQWIQREDGTWLCIVYSSEVAPGQWLFTPQKAKVEEKLADGSMTGAVFLCAIGSGRAVVKELGIEQLKRVLPKLSHTPKDDFVWFMIYKRGDGQYHLENGRTSLDEVL